MGSGRTKIVLIDDNRDMAAVYHKILVNEGYDCRFFLDHETALKALENDQESPTLVFLDFMMPGLSAKDFIVELKRLCPGFESKSRLIIFSSLSPDSPALEDITSQCHGFREKPMDIEEFLHIIKTNLPKA